MTWPLGRVPCAADPSAWDLPVRVHTHNDVLAACEQARRAIAVCRACPGLAACGESRPEYPSVKAGMIHNSVDTPPLHLYQWRDLLGARVRNARRYAAAKHPAHGEAAAGRPAQG